MRSLLAPRCRELAPTPEPAQVLRPAEGRVVAVERDAELIDVHRPITAVRAGRCRHCDRAEHDRGHAGGKRAPPSHRAHDSPVRGSPPCEPLADKINLPGRIEQISPHDGHTTTTRSPLVPIAGFRTSPVRIAAHGSIYAACCRTARGQQHRCFAVGPQRAVRPTVQCSDRRLSGPR
jgi:hypothetical protein